MKRLLIGLAMCGLAHADTIAMLKNQANGVIVLTDRKEGCSKYPGAAYSVSGNSNNTWWGCWYSDDIMVHIDWNDGAKTSYLVDNFTVNHENLRKLRERRGSGGGQSL